MYTVTEPLSTITIGDKTMLLFLTH